MILVLGIHPYSVTITECQVTVTGFIQTDAAFRDTLVLLHDSPGQHLIITVLLVTLSVSQPVYELSGAVDAYQAGSISDQRHVVYSLMMFVCLQPSLATQMLNAAEERPWLWVVYVLTVALPLVLIIVFCCTGKVTHTDRDTLAHGHTHTGIGTRTHRLVLAG